MKDAGAVNVPADDDLFLAQLQDELAGIARTDDERRIVRIAVEALQSFRALEELPRAVSVFGSARDEAAVRWGGLATETAELLAREGYAVITGGGPGLMAAANAGAHAVGGSSVGLTIHLPLLGEPLNPHVQLPVPFHYFFLRKLAFVKYSSAFVCLPGGYGTLDEVFEALNLRRTHRLEPFPVILMGSSFWRGLKEWLATEAVREKTLEPVDLDLMEIIDDPHEVVRRIRRAEEENGAAGPGGGA
jgi:uncharacterized protein (TIGR00730 family)